jgi:N-acetylmuramoyl-L-alanine amidase
MKNVPRKLIVHCSGKNPWTNHVFFSHKEVKEFHTAPEIRETLPDGWFKSSRWIAYQEGTSAEWQFGCGFKDIGYHYTIAYDGKIEKGREEDEVGAHCLGQNAKSLGICLLAVPGAYTIEQMVSLVYLCKKLCYKHRMSLDHVFVHRDFTDKKTCPGFDHDILRRLLRKE